MTAEDPGIRAEAGLVFEAWATELARLLEDAGIDRNASRSLAWTLISSAEGAVVVCRAQRSLEPLEAVRAQLKALVSH